MEGILAQVLCLFDDDVIGEMSMGTPTDEVPIASERDGFNGIAGLIGVLAVIVSE